MKNVIILTMVQWPILDTYFLSTYHLSLSQFLYFKTSYANFVQQLGFKETYNSHPQVLATPCNYISLINGLDHVIYFENTSSQSYRDMDAD